MVRDSTHNPANVGGSEAGKGRIQLESWGVGVLARDTSVYRPV